MYKHYPLLALYIFYIYFIILNNVNNQSILKFIFIVYLLFLLDTTTIINVRVRGDECVGYESYLFLLLLPMYCFMYCSHVFYMTTKQISLLKNSIKYLVSCTS